MKVQRSFTVPAPASTVLAGLTDVERIAECLPGGLVEGRARGGRFGGSFALQLGSATAPYTAIIAAPERDDAAGTAVVTVSGHDDQGDGTAEVKATFAVREEGGVTAVDLELDVELGGRLARASDVEATAESFARTSVAALRSSIATPAEPPPPAGAPPGEAGWSASVSEEPLVPVMPPAPPPVRAPPGEAGRSAPDAYEPPPKPPPPVAAEPAPETAPQPAAEPEPSEPAEATPAPPASPEPDPAAAEPEQGAPPEPPPPPEPPEPPLPPEPPSPPEPPAPVAPATIELPAAERTESVAPPGYRRQGGDPPASSAKREDTAPKVGGGGLLGKLRGLLKRDR